MMDQGSDTPRKALTVAEAAHALALSERVTWDLIRDGRLHSLKVGARRIVPVTALDEFLEAETGRGVA